MSFTVPVRLRDRRVGAGSSGVPLGSENEMPRSDGRRRRSHRSVTEEAEPEVAAFASQTNCPVSSIEPSFHPASSIAPEDRENPEMKLFPVSSNLDIDVYSPASQ